MVGHEQFLFVAERIVKIHNAFSLLRRLGNQ
jgi:hypothetical protein